MIKFPEVDPNQNIFACLFFDCMGKPFRLCFDSEEWAELYAYNHGLDMDFCKLMTLSEAERIGYEY